MAERYQINEGVVIRRHELTSGDVIVTLLGEHGKWQAKVRKGKRPGGHLGKLSLFHDVTAQYYRKTEDNLAVLTQVQLNGALPRLSDPAIYPYAHVLAELVDKLTVDVHIGEDIYKYFVSSLRGLNQGESPAQITIVYAWRLLQTAGLSPRVKSCVLCGSSDLDQRFDIALGGVTCQTCARGYPISADLLTDLQAIHSLSVRDTLARGLTNPDEHFRLLSRFLAYHVTELNSLASLTQLTTHD
ncbi:MAG: DNA repair protein RecO [Trueperaceae bacterium]|nr:DNA repair protein RecO [Trueperaceae bacterium]